MSNEFKIVCGKCQAEATLVADADGDVALCLICGRRNAFEDAQRIAGEHFLHCMIPDLRKDIGGVSKSERGENRTAQQRLGQTHRWHALPL